MFEGIAELIASRRPAIVATQPVKFDCSIQEDHSVDVALTDKPIEAVPGLPGVVSDHLVVLPRTLRMVVKLSNLPDELIPYRPTRHLRLWKTLIGIAMRGEVVDIVTSLEVYTSMVLIHVSNPRTRETSNCLECTVVARKVEFAAIGDVEQELADAAYLAASGAVDLGARAAIASTLVDLVTMGVLVGGFEIGDEANDG